jgi:hypothetical protein
MTNLEMRRGDLKPDLVIHLDDRNGPIPVSTAASASVVVAKNGALLFKRAADISVDGQVTYEWQTNDTATPGTLKVEVEIIWPGSKPETIRASGVVTVLPDLG